MSDITLEEGPARVTQLLTTPAAEPELTDAPASALLRGVAVAGMAASLAACGGGGDGPG
ncbi:MAG: hypothetical protein IAE92_01635, partial [Burkholderiaceae bacterium]|nr:hypothetical protein [Burkholderiaceae bacterium]